MMSPSNYLFLSKNVLKIPLIRINSAESSKFLLFHSLAKFVTMRNSSANNGMMWKHGYRVWFEPLFSLFANLEFMTAQEGKHSIYAPL